MENGIERLNDYSLGSEQCLLFTVRHRPRRAEFFNLEMWNVPLYGSLNASEFSQVRKHFISELRHTGTQAIRHKQN